MADQRHSVVASVPAGLLVGVVELEPFRTLAFDLEPGEIGHDHIRRIRPAAVLLTATGRKSLLRKHA